MKCRQIVWSCVLLGVVGCGRATVTTIAIEEGSTVVGEGSQPVAGTPFTFPKDASGAVAAKVLTPTDPRRPLADPAVRPRPFPAPRIALYPPTATLPPAVALVTPLKAEPTQRPLLPRLVADEATFSPREELSLPQAVSFPVPDRVRLARDDVNRPLQPPVLAIPVADRAPLDDPTAPLSVEAALAAPLPLRQVPAPFLRLSLPEPYENRRTSPLPMIEPEGNPVVASPRQPR